MSTTKLLRRYFRHGILPQLLVFEAVARLGSVTRAAAALHLAQPTVSVQLKKLADALDVALFEPDGRRLRLTAAGRSLCESCAELRECLSRTDERLAAWREPATEHLLLAAEPDVREVATRLADAFRSRHPEVKVTLNIVDRTDLLARCTAGTDDVYVLALEVDGLPASRRFSVTHASGREIGPCAALFLREALSRPAGDDAVTGEAAVGTAADAGAEPAAPAPSATTEKPAPRRVPTAPRTAVR